MKSEHLQRLRFLHTTPEFLFEYNQETMPNIWSVFFSKCTSWAIIVVFINVKLFDLN